MEVISVIAATSSLISSIIKLTRAVSINRELFLLLAIDDMLDSLQELALSRIPADTALGMSIEDLKEFLDALHSTLPKYDHLQSRSLKVMDILAYPIRRRKIDSALNRMSVLRNRLLSAV
jgi:hypothetical protein